jgi:type I restriction enzyme R subunit
MAVRDSKQADFRHNDFKERRIKAAILNVIRSRYDTENEAKEEVERIYAIIVEQEEY